MIQLTKAAFFIAVQIHRKLPRNTRTGVHFQSRTHTRTFVRVIICSIRVPTLLSSSSDIIIVGDEVHVHTLYIIMYMVYVTA